MHRHPEYWRGEILNGGFRSLLCGFGRWVGLECFVGVREGVVWLFGVVGRGVGSVLGVGANWWGLREGGGGGRFKVDGLCMGLMRAGVWGFGEGRRGELV